MWKFIFCDELIFIGYSGDGITEIDANTVLAQFVVIVSPFLLSIFEA